MRPEALAALDGVEMILHAGDVGALNILHELERFAPVHAVYGNVDDPAFGWPEALSLTLGGLTVHISHGHELGNPTPAKLAARYRADVIVYGHTHKPLIERTAGALVINPGAAGPRRFNLQPSVGILDIDGQGASAEIVPLDIR
ncbi:metallophosphoesterase family protein [soil metagenome]